MKVVIFFGLLAVMQPAFAAKVNDSVDDAIPETFIAACELSFPTSEVEVSFRDKPVKESQKESIRSLTALARKYNAAHSSEHHVLGLTTSELSWEIGSEFKSLPLGSPDIHCARPKIKIELEVNYHVVHIASELPPQSCEYNFVHDHEYEHVKINKDNMQRYIKEIVADFKKHFPNKILYGSSEKLNREMQKAMSNEWLPFIKEVTAKMEAEGIKRHQAIDTPEEYAKGSTVCSGKISAIIRASESK